MVVAQHERWIIISPGEPGEHCKFPGIGFGVLDDRTIAPGYAAIGIPNPAIPKIPIQTPRLLCQLAGRSSEALTTALHRFTQLDIREPRAVKQ